MAALIFGARNTALNNVGKMFSPRGDFVLVERDNRQNMQVNYGVGCRETSAIKTVKQGRGRRSVLGER